MKLPTISHSLFAVGFIAGAAALLGERAALAQTVYSGTSTTGTINTAVGDFRAALGTLNSNVAGSFGSGRREINWDGVLDSFSRPNALPANFFNVNSPRGAVFSTAGTGFATSADSNNPTATPLRFSDLNATYSTAFSSFSPERLFTAIGSNILDISFFIPGSTTPAAVMGFGAVFADVDIGPSLPTQGLGLEDAGVEGGVASATQLLFFGTDANQTLIGTFNVPAAAGDGGLSFVGVMFSSAIVGRVRIISGNSALGPNDITQGGAFDIVALDDFIYGEPLAVPEQSSVALAAAGVVGLLGAMARRRFLWKKNAHA